MDVNDDSVGFDRNSSTQDEVFDSEGDNIYEVETILKKRIHKGKVQYQVKWMNYGIDEYTWEPVENLFGCHALIEKFELEH